jgi:hypothetical protein
MSADADLDTFVASLSQQLTAIRRAAADPARLDPALVIGELEAAGAVDLARDTAELPNPLHWLSAVVRTCAGFSPAVAFSLGARFAAQRIPCDLESEEVTASVASGVGGTAWRATVTGLFPPASVVLLERADVAGRVVSWSVLEEERSVERTGLQGADLRTVTMPAPGTGIELTGDTARQALFELDLLNASVALGLLERAVATTEEYAANRRQFGGPIANFAGLAAILVDMRLRSSAVAGLLAEALEGRRDGAELAAVAGRACVEACLDAIQVHGGYGYIDEYPVAGLLRDAVSLRARAGGRRSAVAAVAAAHLPSV